MTHELIVNMQTTPSDQSLTTPTTLSPVLQVKHTEGDIQADSLDRIVKDSRFPLLDNDQDATIIITSPPFGGRGSETEGQSSGMAFSLPKESILANQVPIIPSGPLVARPPTRPRSASGTLSSNRKPELRLTLTTEEKASFSASILKARANLVSDAVKLPKSTNMGFGNDVEPGSRQTRRADPVVIPPTTRAEFRQALAKPSDLTTTLWPIPQPISAKEQTYAPSEHEAMMNAHDSQAHSWEESETFDRPRTQPKKSPETKKPQAIFLRAIPCMYVANVKNATSFYKDILGFSVLGRPDSSHASLVRSPSHMANNSTLGRQGRATMKHAPADSVQIYLRIAPMGEDGERVQPPPMTLWIMVNDVDQVYLELQEQWDKFAPRTDEYFPMHSFGDAKIVSKPQNKAWGNRELHVIDGDENKIIFFRELY